MALKNEKLAAIHAPAPQPAAAAWWSTFGRHSGLVTQGRESISAKDVYFGQSYLGMWVRGVG